MNLTPAEAKAARDMHIHFGMETAELARMYRVSRRSMYDILVGNSHKNSGGIVDEKLGRSVAVQRHWDRMTGDERKARMAQLIAAHRGEKRSPDMVERVRQARWGNRD